MTGEGACAGAAALPRCTLRYAPPEVISAYNRSAKVVVHPSLDIWALGVMAFEALTQRPAFATGAALFAAAAGDAPFPWAASERAAAPASWRRSRLRPVVEACLARDAAARPTAAGLLQMLVDLVSASSL